MRTADVVVIGGGVIGSATAYYCATRGLRVTLIDQPRRGRATSASAGGLWPIGESVGLGCGVIYHKMHSGSKPSPLPDCFFEFSMRSNAMFPALSEELREATGLDIEWQRTALLFVLFDEGDFSFARSIAARYPMAAARMSWLTPEELARAEPSLTRGTLGAVVFHGDDQVNPYRLADAFRAGARSLDATILSHMNVTGLQIRSGRVAAVETDSGSVPCDLAINAAGSWAAQIGRMAGVDIPVHPVRGQLLGTEALPKTLGACISTSDCYLAQKHHGEIVIGSTTEEVGYDTSVTHSAMKTLATGAIRAVPSLADVTLKRTWSGLRPGTPDELPILGPVDSLAGYLNACGHFRTGILNAPLTGLLLSQIAAGDPPSIDVGPFLLRRFAEAPAR